MSNPRSDPKDGDAVNWRSASLWAQTPMAHYPSFQTDRSADVVVVGAGITGLLTATLLARSGADVVVLDRHDIGGVATRNTTGKITALQGTVYRTIRGARGPEVAAEYAAAQLDAVDGIRGVVEDLGIECALTEAPAFTYATEPDSLTQARDEHEAALAAGLPVRWVTETDLPFPVAGAVRLDHQLHFDPEAFCAALAAALGSERVAGQSPVMQVQEGRDGCTVLIDGGAKLTAGHVVIATQAPIVDPALLANRCTPMQSYALAARIPGAVPDGMYLSCDRSVRSLRPAFVDGAVIAVVGGEGHHMGEGAATSARWDGLAEWTAERFGGVEVTHRWATHDLVASDHVPFIGRLSPGSQRRWVATGFAKWGMTNGYVAAKLITEAIGRRQLPWSSAFDATRIASTVNRELVSIGKTATAHLVVDRLVRRAAPRCSHQGCVLQEDAALGTSDCPCHGSRFDADGAVVQGPAIAPLSRRP